MNVYGGEVDYVLQAQPLLTSGMRVWNVMNIFMEEMLCKHH